MALPKAVTAALPETSEVRPRAAALADLDARVTAGVGRGDRVRLGVLEPHRADILELGRREVKIKAEQFSVLLPQPDDLRVLHARHPSSGASVDLGPLHPTPQRSPA